MASATGPVAEAAASGGERALSRERIIDAALALIDREGAGALSMRRVAAELGAGTMSLYNHVADKAELQDALLERVLEGIEYRPDPHPQASGRQLAHDVRSRFLEHPGTIGLLGSGAQAESLVRSFADSYQDLTDRSVPGTTAIKMIAAVSRYTIGSLLAELYGPAAGESREQRDAEFDFGLDALFTGFAVRLGLDPEDLPLSPA